MKYYSDTLNMLFDSAEACEAAEKERAEKLAAEKKKKEELSIARKARAKEVEEALEAVKKARAHYNEVLSAFCKDYGTFHFSWSTKDTFPSIFDFLDL